MVQWCAYQPHPLLFVWSYLCAGLIRSHASHRSLLGDGAFCRLLAKLAIADLICYHTFVVAASYSLHSIGGVVNAWLLSLAVGYFVRVAVAQRASRRSYAAFLRAAVLSAAGLGTIAAAAASSALVLVLAMLLLKLELQERGDALDSARYGWHIATFYLSAGFGTACTRGARTSASPSPWLPKLGLKGSEVNMPNRNTDDAGAAAVEGQPLMDPELDGAWSPVGALGDGTPRRFPLHDVHGLPLAAMTSVAAAAPLAASLVGVGALGVLPRHSDEWRACGACRAAWRRAPRRLPPQALLLGASVAALCGYVAAVRLWRAPPSELGVLLAESTCGAAADGAAADGAATEWIAMGDQWTVLGLMYGPRRVAVPKRCEGGAKATAEAHATSGGGEAGGEAGDEAGGEAGRAGLVLAADGSQRKYAEAVYVALHNIRTLHASALPAEVSASAAPSAYTPAFVQSHALWWPLPSAAPIPPLPSPPLSVPLLPSPSVPSLSFTADLPLPLPLPALSMAQGAPRGCRRGVRCAEQRAPPIAQPSGSARHAAALALEHPPPRRQPPALLRGQAVCDARRLL